MIRFRVDVAGGFVDFKTEALAIEHCTPLGLNYYQVNIPNDNVEAIKSSILKPAQDFGQNLKDAFASENIGQGITQAGKTRIVADLLRDVDYYLSSGSLYEALAEIDRLVYDSSYAPFVTAERLRIFKNKIRRYVGLPEIP
ncbi:MAG: hypothetical protein ACRCXD_14575 [Luteolibacter sp.]